MPKRRLITLVPLLFTLACIPLGEGPGLDAGNNEAADAGTTDRDAGQDQMGTVTVRISTAAGDAAVGAKISIPGTTLTATTGATGSATIDGITPGKVLVQVVPTGGIAIFGSATVAAGADAEIVLQLPNVQAATAEQSASGVTSVSVGGAQLGLPPSGGLVTATGTTYTGPVEVRVATLENAVAVPGFELPAENGSSAVVLAPTVAFDVSVVATGGAQAGELLQLATGGTATFRRPVPASDPLAVRLGTDAKTLTLRRFDPTTATWTDAGTLAWDGSTLVTTLGHLSIYGGFDTAFYRMTYEIPTGCMRGVVMNGSQPAAAALLLRYLLVWDGGMLEFEERVRSSAADGTYSLRMPLATPAPTVTGWSAADPTRVTKNGWIANVRLWAGGVTQPTPALAPNGAAEACSATSPALPTVQLAPAASPPACRADATRCDDHNPCTTDTCSTSDCPAGTSCSGCTNTPGASAPPITATLAVDTCFDLETGSPAAPSGPGPERCSVDGDFYWMANGALSWNEEKADAAVVNKAFAEVGAGDVSAATFCDYVNAPACNDRSIDPGYRIADANVTYLVRTAAGHVYKIGWQATNASTQAVTFLYALVASDTCDDGNSCTTGDHCVAGTCVATRDSSPTPAAGEPSPPVLAKAHGARRIAIADSFDAAPDPALVNEHAQGATSVYAGGRLVFNPPTAGADLDWYRQYPAQPLLHGAGTAELTFLGPVIQDQYDVQLHLSLSGQSGTAGLQLWNGQPGGGFSFGKVINGSSGGSTWGNTANVNLAENVEHRLKIEAKASGEVIFTVTPNGGQPLSETLAGFNVNEAFRVEVSVSVRPRNGTPTTGVKVALADLTTTFGYDAPESWTLNGSAMAWNGNTYDGDPSGNGGRPTMIYTAEMGDDGPDSAASGGTTKAFPFTPGAAVRCLLVSLSQQGQSMKVTVFTTRPRADLEAFLQHEGFTFSIDKDFEAFRWVNGAYRWVVPTCP